MAAYPSTSKSEKDEEAKYRAEADLRTLVDAEEIKGDKARMSAAMACAKDKMDAMQAVRKAHS